MNIAYIDGGSELIDTIQPLWEQLNQLHERISPNFKDEFQTNTFERRKIILSERYNHGQLRLELARRNRGLVGYYISGINQDRIGAIESIFIIEAFRGQNIGETLMLHTIEWMDQLGATSKVIDVAVGNEQAFKFYARFGFFPRTTRLKQKNNDTKP